MDSLEREALVSYFKIRGESQFQISLTCTPKNYITELFDCIDIIHFVSWIRRLEYNKNTQDGIS